MSIWEVQNAKMLYATWRPDIRFWRPMALRRSPIIHFGSLSASVERFKNQNVGNWFCLSNYKFHSTWRFRSFPLSFVSCRGTHANKIFPTCLVLLEDELCNFPIFLTAYLGTRYQQGWRNSKPRASNVLYGSKYIQRTLASSIFSARCNYWDCVRNHSCLVDLHPH